MDSTANKRQAEMNILSPKSNGVAKEIRGFLGSLFIFLFVMGIIVGLIKFPVLETNKETVLMLIGAISASIPVIISSITGTKPDDVQALRATLDKKEHQIELLVKAKDQLEAMVIDLQKQMLETQNSMMDNLVLKAALEFDNRDAARNILNKKKDGS